MMTFRKSLAITLTAILFACTGGAGEPRQTSAVVRGGTFRIGMTSDVLAGFDPQKEYYNIGWEFFRCCLLRTLLSYDPGPRGLELAPDLASALPTVSPDGRT